MIEFKRGESFTFDLQITDESDEPMVLTGYELSSQLRDQYNQLITDLELTEIDSTTVALEFLEEDVYGDTNDWPLGPCFMDIDINDNGRVVSTDTILVSIVKDYTRPSGD